MSIEVYFLISAIVAGRFAGGGRVADGDYKKIVAILVIAALWPVAAGAGIGLIVRDACRWMVRRGA